MKKVLFSIIFSIIFTPLVFSAELRYDIPLGDSPQLGPSNAPVTIIEFLDFQ